MAEQHYLRLWLRSNITVRSCVGYFVSEVADNLNPFTFNAATFAAQAGSEVGSRLAFNATLKRMGTMPDRKFANLFKDYQVKQLTKVTSFLEDGAPLISLITAEGQAFVSEMSLMSNGGCQ